MKSFSHFQILIYSIKEAYLSLFHQAENRLEFLNLTFKKSNLSINTYKQFLVILLYVISIISLNPQEKGLKIISQQPGENKGNRWAIIVGVNHYEDSDIPSLNKAVNDSEGFYEALRTYGQFSDNRLFLLNDVAREKDLLPTKSKIEQKIDYVLDMAEPDDLILFYFSGHGITDKKAGRGYLIPSDANDKKLFQTSISIDEIVQQIKTKGIKKSILMLDACRNEMQEGKKSVGGISGLTSKIFQNAEVSATFYSTRDSYFSYEDHESEYGVYTRYILEGMRGDADNMEYGGNGDGIVSFKELQNFVGIMVDEWSLRNKKKQKPLTKFTREIFGDIPISMINFSPENKNEKLQVNCENRGGEWDPQRNRCKEKLELDKEKELILLKLKKDELERISKLKKDCEARKGKWVNDICKEKSTLDEEELIAKREKCERSGGFLSSDNSCIKLSSLGEKTIRNTIGMEFIQIPGGVFDMGCSAGDNECYESEKPVHKISITKPFYMGKYEVTQSQWKAVMGNNPSYFIRGGDNLPVERVSYDDVQEFIRKLNSKEGINKYRLPTEAEWEYAARAGSKTKYYWGNNIDESFLWYYENSDDTTHPVGQKKPNAFGLYDMCGNVLEWVQDWKDDSYYGRSPTNDPVGATSGTYMVQRGGSWYSNARLSRISYRAENTPIHRDNFVGFRLIRIP